MTGLYPTITALSDYWFPSMTWDSLSVQGYTRSMGYQRSQTNRILQANAWMSWDIHGNILYSSFFTSIWIQIRKVANLITYGKVLGGTKLYVNNKTKPTAGVLRGSFFNFHHRNYNNCTALKPYPDDWMYTDIVWYGFTTYSYLFFILGSARVWVATDFTALIFDSIQSPLNISSIYIKRNSGNTLDSTVRKLFIVSSFLHNIVVSRIVFKTLFEPIQSKPGRFHTAWGIEAIPALHILIRFFRNK